MAPFLAVLALAVLAVHAWSYLPFIADDALISLRYAERLLDGDGLTWNDGERLEGYSNLLWILGCAALGLLGADLIQATRILGLAGSALAILAVVWGYRPKNLGDPLPALAGGLGLALCGPVAVWSVGGLEQPLLAALLAWALVLCYRLLEPGDGSSGEWVVPGVLLALLCWTRPDGALFTVSACAGLLLARGISRGSLALCLRLATLPALAYLAQLAFRLAYYGDWLPNSAHAKLGFGLARLGDGLEYLGGGLWMLGGLALPALSVSLYSLRRGNAPRVRFLAPTLVLWSAYVAVIGGDLFPARRHLVPLVVVLALLLAQGLQDYLRRGAAARVVAWSSVAVLFTVLAVMQRNDPQNRRARLERWEWDGEVIGKLLHAAFFDRQPLVAVDPGGTLPYFSKLPSLDMLGINDRHLARHRPADFGGGWLGHELGDGRYVLDREPDLIVFCRPGGGARPCFRSGKELVRDPRFRQGYRLVTFEGDDPYPFRSRIWARVEEGRIGIERKPDRVVVPAHLLMANSQSVARLDSSGRLGVEVTPETPAGFAGLQLGAGRWRLEIESEGSPVGVQARVAGTGRTVFSGVNEVVFELAEPAGETLDLLFTPAAEGQSHLHRLVFEKVGSGPAFSHSSIAFRSDAQR